jgi:hypothetical protein
MAARTLIDTGRGKFALRARGPAGEDKTTVAIAAFDEVRLAHLQPDAGMTQSAADAVAGHTPGADDHQLRVWQSGGLFGRHGIVRF